MPLCTKPKVNSKTTICTNLAGLFGNTRHGMLRSAGRGRWYPGLSYVHHLSGLILAVPYLD